MVIWGGRVDDGVNPAGGRYNPATDTWTPVSTTIDKFGFASRRNHTAVWTGTEMIVFGGEEDKGDALQGVGIRYRPSDDSWAQCSPVGAPSPRLDHAAVWTGKEMIIWGGTKQLLGTERVDGARYDPATDEWKPMSVENASGDAGVAA